jgi:hypothetical protein
MATDSMVAGLFATPEMYQQQQDQLAQQQAIQMAQLSPEQRAQADIRGGFQRAGNAVGGLMGAQDPQMRLAAMRQQVLQGLNPNDPNSIAQAAQSLAQAGDQQGAAQLAQMARESAFKYAEIGAKQADTAVKTAQLSAEGISAKLLQTGKYTPESIAKFQTTNNSKDLEVIDQTAKPSAEWLGTAKELGLPAARSFNDYTPEQVAAVNNKLFQQSIAKAQAGRATTVFQQESEFAKTLGAEQAKKLTGAIDQATTSSDALNRLSQMKKLNDTGTLYSGPQANATVTTANLLNSIGLVSKEEANKLSNSEVYSKLAKDLVMKDLGGKLGAQVSNSDRDYVESRIPQLTTSPKARTELLTKLQEIHAKNINYAKRMQTYAEKKGSLQGFEFVEPTANVGTKENPIVLK